jgi:hypothetical protein
MEWTLESGQTVVWQWSQAPATAPVETAGERYAIRIHIDGRRLRGSEASEWKQRIGAEFPGTDV